MIDAVHHRSMRDCPQRSREYFILASATYIPPNTWIRWWTYLRALLSFADWLGLVTFR